MFVCRVPILHENTQFSFQPLCQPYHELATSYMCNIPAEVQAVLTKHAEVFTRVSFVLFSDEISLLSLFITNFGL